MQYIHVASSLNEPLYHHIKMWDMSARCPRCGEKYFICGLCNAELLSVEAVLLQEGDCKIHYCSEECLNQELLHLRAVYVDVSADMRFPHLVDLKTVELR